MGSHQSYYPSTWHRYRREPVIRNLKACSYFLLKLTILFVTCCCVLRGVPRFTLEVASLFFYSLIRDANQVVFHFAPNKFYL